MVSRIPCDISETCLAFLLTRPRGRNAKNSRPVTNGATCERSPTACPVFTGKTRMCNRNTMRCVVQRVMCTFRDTNILKLKITLSFILRALRALEAHLVRNCIITAITISSKLMDLMGNLK